ncbi:hypothetical protein C8R43DRAFT_1193310 [Mycena crocata]|nr:hypothetical protein C8R43DRAFT_1193310 [Mycena crocata]
MTCCRARRTERQAAKPYVYRRPAVDPPPYRHRLPSQLQSITPLACVHNVDAVQAQPVRHSQLSDLPTATAPQHEHLPHDESADDEELHGRVWATVAGGGEAGYGVVGFLPTTLPVDTDVPFAGAQGPPQQPPANPRPPPPAPCGLLFPARDAVIGLADAARLVVTVCAELERSGATTLFVFSALVLDVRRAGVVRLVRTFLETCDDTPNNSNGNGHGGRRRGGRQESEARWAEEARFAGAHELGMCLRRGLSRLVGAEGGRERVGRDTLVGLVSAAGRTLMALDGAWGREACIDGTFAEDAGFDARGLASMTWLGVEGGAHFYFDVLTAITSAIMRKWLGAGLTSVLMRTWRGVDATGMYSDAHAAVTSAVMRGGFGDGVVDTAAWPNTHPPTAFSMLLASLPAQLPPILAPLFALCPRLVAHSNSSGHRPPSLVSVLSPCAPASSPNFLSPPLSPTSPSSKFKSKESSKASALDDLPDHRGLLVLFSRV